MTDFQTKFAVFKATIDEALIAAMDATQSPEPLLSAMRYSLLSEGKRLRPVLLLAACETAGGDVREALPYACALEMIHTYSLIHDDLPAMDDDALRRGKPTNHIVFGEGMALLAGDGLLSLAFETMLKEARTTGHIAAMRCIANAAGVRGMVAGQCLDIHNASDMRRDSDTLRYIHLHKTADLFIGAISAGLLLADAPEKKRAAGERFAKALGVAFQIRDDLLDTEGNADTIGKQTGMDACRGKITWPGIYGVARAKEDLVKWTNEALENIGAFSDGAFMRDATMWLLTRES